MKLQWDLTEFFENSERFYKEIDSIKEKLIDIKKYQNVELNENSLFTLLEEKWQIKELTNNILIYGSLMYYKNINSPLCIELKKNCRRI